MSRPLKLIALVGRPNVGKSTLFNRMVGRRAALVQDMPGVTRDRHYGDGELLERRFMVVDTGGFEPLASEGMLSAMRVQAEIAIEEADVVIALFDGTEGLLPADEEITRMLVRSGKAVYYAVNKIDGPRHDALVADFYSLGVDPLWPISAEHGGGVLDLMEAIFEEQFPPLDADAEAADPSVTRIAVIGKPNAGKSTLVNRMLGEERLLVSDIPGTTRDAIDTWLEAPPDPLLIEQAEERLAAARRAFEDEEVARDELNERLAEEDPDDGITVMHHVAGDSADDWRPEVDVEHQDWVAPVGDGSDRAVVEAEAALERARGRRRYLLIDTAGIRRRKWITTSLERASIIQSFKSIDRSEVCLLLIDATHGVTDQDAKLAGLIAAKGRACAILVNKWDIMPDKDTHTSGTFIKQLHADLPFIAWAPVQFISAKTGQRTHRVLQLVDQVKATYHRRIPTGEFNRFIAECVARHQPPIHKGRRLKFYYASQVATAPPTFVMWVNDATALHFSYKRFLLNRLRERWDLEGTPIKLVVRSRDESKRKPKKGGKKQRKR